MKLTIEFSVTRTASITVEASEADLDAINKDGRLPFWDKAYQNALNNPEHETCDYCVRDENENVLVDWDD